ncbi:MAG: hypothetical protein ACREJC_16620, partial [Tepidisphaeraceae bacterium]
FNRKNLMHTSIPWEKRAAIGPLAAFWRTLVTVTFRPRKLVENVEHVPSLVTARSFRVFAVLLAWVPLVLLCFALRDQRQLLRQFDRTGVWTPFVIDPWMLSVAVAGLGLWLLAATAVPGSFAGGRDAPSVRRAMALTQYAAAPLAWCAILALLALAGNILTISFDDKVPGHTTADTVLAWIGRGMQIGALSLGGLLFVWWWIVSIYLLAKSGGAGSVRCAVAAILTPILWTVLAVCLVAVPPLAVTYVAVMLKNL